MMEDAKEPKWEALDKFTILRQKGVVSLGFYQRGKTNGESAAKIDWIKIETPEKYLRRPDMGARLFPKGTVTLR